MQTIDIPLNQLHEAPWNPNVMDEAMQSRLRASLRRFGLVENLVVRPVGKDRYEVLNGNQRLKVLNDSGYSAVSCVIVDLDNARARLLSQALNRIEGEDNPGLRAELIKKAMESVSEEEVLSILPETAESLQSLASLGEEDMSSYLRNWQQAQTARLHHAQFQLTKDQSNVVEEALKSVLPTIDKSQAESPNIRGTALYVICKAYINKEVSNHG